METNKKYIAGIITIPERTSAVQIPLRGLSEYGIPCKLFVDEKHKGVTWNEERMYLDFCMRKYDAHIILGTDDFIFKDGWYETVDNIMNNTDYDVLCLFTNRKVKPDDPIGVKKASAPMWFYDQCVVFRNRVLDETWAAGYMAFVRDPARTKKELSFADCTISSYLYHSGLKCATVRPNLIRLQPIKSSIGNHIVIKEN